MQRGGIVVVVYKAKQAKAADFVSLEEVDNQ
jgi:hypothetical protein